MKALQPPVLATWMLEHLLVNDSNEALAGDLLEEFQQRRSPGWYWRQVIAAIIVSLANAWRQQWVALTLQFAFIWAWTYYCQFCLFPFLRVRFWELAFEPHARLVWWLLSHHGEVLWI